MSLNIEWLFCRTEKGSWTELTRSFTGLDDSISIVDDFCFSLGGLSPELSWFEREEPGCGSSLAMSGDEGADMVSSSTFCLLAGNEVCSNRVDDNDDDDDDAYMSICSMPGATVGVKGI